VSPVPVQNSESRRLSLFGIKRPSYGVNAQVGFDSSAQTGSYGCGYTDLAAGLAHHGAGEALRPSCNAITASGAIILAGDCPRPIAKRIHGQASAIIHVHILTSRSIAVLFSRQ
jgi:hypothetical protein